MRTEYEANRALARTAARAINAAHMRAQSAMERRHTARVSYRARLRRAEQWANVAVFLAGAVLVVFLGSMLFHALRELLS